MFKKYLKDETGGITTVEVIGYTILLGGAAALIGFGLTGAYRGLTSDIVKKLKKLVQI